jgi:hypothetical protein
MRSRKVLTLLFGLFLALPGRSVVLDRIAAIVDREVITVTEIDQLQTLRIIPRGANEDEPTYRRRLLDAMIAQSLRFREVERFGAIDVSADSIEARLGEVIGRFASEDEFEEALLRAEVTRDEVRTIIKRQLQVEAYIEERFSPLIFVSLEEIDQYYRSTWVPQRTSRNLPVRPVAESQEEIRTLLKSERLEREITGWTEQLRSRANVDVYTTEV